MQTKKILSENWSYPVNEHMSAVYDNINAICDEIDDAENIDLVGIGASGAFLLGATTMLSSGVNPILLRKDKDHKRRTWTPRFRLNTEIMIIDDHFRLGESLKMISRQLDERDVSLRNNVTTYIARCWENDNPEYLSKGKKLLKELYPNIKVWLH